MLEDSSVICQRPPTDPVVGWLGNKLVDIATGGTATCLGAERQTEFYGAGQVVCSNAILVETLIGRINVPSLMFPQCPVAAIMTVDSGVRFNALPKEALAPLIGVQITIPVTQLSSGSKYVCVPGSTEVACYEIFYP